MSYFTEPALLWLAGTVMGEVGARNILQSQQFCSWLARSGPVTFHGASNTVVGWNGYWRGRAHKIFHGASITVGSSSLP